MKPIIFIFFHIFCSWHSNFFRMAKKDTINKIDFTFQMPKLVNGDYVVGVAISEGSVLDFKVLTWLYNVLYMQITNVGNNDGILQLDTNIEIYSKGVENE